jgi:hypothetical protein
MNENRRDPFAITISDILAQGANSLDATCRSCGHEWLASAEILPPVATLTLLQNVMQCPACGEDGIDLEPRRPEPPPPPN